MLLEAKEHKYSSFLTLTYDEENNPGGNLNPRDLQLFLKRVRKEVAPCKIRFYAVGEYGTKTKRPHYHLIIFGMEPLHGEAITRKCWRYGHILVREATPARMSYCAGYVQKGWTNRMDQRLEGKHPEFSRMSLRPGLGAGAVVRIKTAYESERGRAALYQSSGFPNLLVRMEQTYPLGKYLTKKLHDTLGISKEERIAQYQQIHEDRKNGLLPPLKKAYNKHYRKRIEQI